VWSSPEGQALYSLYTSPDGRLPMSEVEYRIGKAALLDDAWSVFLTWRAG
jgi:hypothetical protein